MAEETLPQLLMRNYRRFGNRGVAMRKRDLGIWREYTWKDYYENVKCLCLGLVSLGFGPGQKLSIIGDNDPQWFWGEFASQAAGGAAVGIHTDCTPPEVKYYLEHSDSTFILAKDQEQVDKVLEVKNTLPLLRGIIYWDPKGLWFYQDPLLMALPQVQERGKKYEAEHPGSFEEMVEGGKGAGLALLAYTSGTTGLPKGAMITHRNLLYYADALQQIDPAGPKDEYLSYVPPAWIAEQMVGVTRGLHAPFIINFPEEPETFQEDIRAIGPHLLFYGPRLWESVASTIRVRISDTTFLKRLLYRFGLAVGYQMTRFEEKKRRPPFYWQALHALADFLVLRALRDKVGLMRIRLCYTGAAAIDPEAIRFFRALGINLKNTYGSTEASIVTVMRSDDIKLDTVGSVIPGVEVRIAENGEILVKSEGVFSGYYKNPQATAEKLKDGWYYTGDAGFLDADGHLVYLDRVDELQELAGGKRFAPQSTEVRLRFSPYIKDAMVVGGKERPYAVSVVNIDFSSVGKWAEARNLAYTTYVDLSQKLEVRELIAREIRQVNQRLPEAARIAKFVNLHKEFDPDEAELTRTRKLKRGFLEKRYQDLIEAIYQSKEDFRVQAEVRYRDGRTGVITTDIKINTVKPA